MKKYFFLRMGSNAEKKYIAKMKKSFSGIMIRANFFESSPGMLTSLFIDLTSSNVNTGYIIDPISYVFAKEGALRTWQKVKKEEADTKLVEQLRLEDDSKIDAQWKKDIRNPIVQENDKIEILGVNKSYSKLCQKYFSDNICSRLPTLPLQKNDFTDEFVRSIITTVIEYQNNVISTRYDTAKYEDVVAELPKPMFLLAPYFTINDMDWLDINFKIWDVFQDMVDLEKGAIVINIDANTFINNLKIIITKLTTLKIKTIFLWFDGLKETDLDVSQHNILAAYAELVSKMASLNKEVINLYAGGFSMYLLRFGLAGIVNGPGYGLDRDVEPIQGGSPTAKYYIPFMHKRESILETYDKLAALDLGEDDNSFKKDICDCAICKKGLEVNKEKSAKAFILEYYGKRGEMQLCRDGTYRSFPTPACLERSVFHFMLARLKEYKWINTSSKDEIVFRISEEIEKGKHLVNGYLNNWKAIIQKMAIY